MMVLFKNFIVTVFPKLCPIKENGYIILEDPEQGFANFFFYVETSVSGLYAEGWGGVGGGVITTPPPIPPAEQIILKSCSFSSETELTPQILA